MEATPYSQTPRGQLLKRKPEPVDEPVAFSDTPRAQYLEQQPTVAVEPVKFFTPDGETYEATDPGEINRLKLSRTHFLAPEDAANPLQADDTRFHPGAPGVQVADVLKYLAEHPEDAERVLEEERSGKARKGILEPASSTEGSPAS